MQSIATLTIDSREVATMIEKRHDHLVRDIKKYLDTLLTTPKLGALNFFQDSTYKDAKGETRPCYRLTRKGCEFVANKMTGKKGILFTANYINRFHEMEKELMKKRTERKPDYNSIEYHRISGWLGSAITNAVRSSEEADACLDAILCLIPPKDIAPVRCLVQEYGRLVHQSADNESHAVDECGQDNYERYRADCRQMRDFCVRSVKDFKDKLNEK